MLILLSYLCSGLKHLDLIAGIANATPAFNVLKQLKHL